MFYIALGVGIVGHLVVWLTCPKMVLCDVRLVTPRDLITTPR